MGNEAINIEGSAQRTLVIKVDETANDVTVVNGYKVFAGSVIPVNVDGGRRIGAIGYCRSDSINLCC